MISRLIFALIILISTSATYGEEYFQSCDDLVKDSSYKLLADYFNNHHNAEPMECQRLNEHEFLYTTSDNIFYCRSDKGKPLTCDVSESGTWFPDLSIEAKFTGGKGKQFVLFKVSRLSHGNFGEGYHAFFLVPKSINPRGYTLYFFREAGSHDRNDAEGVCGPDDDEIVTSANPPFEIKNESQNNVIVRFNQEKINCTTKKKFRQTLEYTWKDFSFEQTLNRLEAIQQRR